jgi:hypothetical protein
MAENTLWLEDGKAFKPLKRHLRTHKMTAEQYRAKWNLPPDYPMVAKQMGLASNYAIATAAEARNLLHQLSATPWWIASSPDYRRPISSIVYEVVLNLCRPSRWLPREA